MKKITPEPNHHEATRALDWLSHSDINSVDESGLNDIVRLLIARINQLSGEVDFLRNVVNRHEDLL